MPLAQPRARFGTPIRLTHPVQTRPLVPPNRWLRRSPNPRATNRRLRRDKLISRLNLNRFRRRTAARRELASKPHPPARDPLHRIPNNAKLLHPPPNTPPSRIRAINVHSARRASPLRSSRQRTPSISSPRDFLQIAVRPAHPGKWIQIRIQRRDHRPATNKIQYPIQTRALQTKPRSKRNHNQNQKKHESPHALASMPRVALNHSAASPSLPARDPRIEPANHVSSNPSRNHAIPPTPRPLLT
jgi:hypothetical protein